MTDPVRSRGLLGSLSNALVSAIELAQVRLALLGCEVEVEKRRIFDGILWGAISFLCVGIGLVLLCAFVLMLILEDFRIAVTAAMGLFFLGCGAALLREARRRLQTPTSMFELSAAELERDRLAASRVRHE